jgi:cell division protein FtsB
MLDFRKKKIARKVMYSPWSLAILFILAIFMAKAAWNVHVKERSSAEVLERTQTELEKLSARQTNLGTAVAYLSTPQGVETEIRTKFRVAKEGESVAIILEDATSTNGSGGAGLKRGFWYRLTHLFSGE